MARQLLLNFLGVMVGNYGALAVALVISIVLTRRLGVEEFGHVTLLLMASQVLLLLASNWTHAGFVRFGSHEFISSGTLARIFWARFWIVTPLIVFAALGVLGSGEYLASYLSIPRAGLALVLGHFILSYVLSSLGAAFQARQEMSRYGTILFCEKAGTLAIVLLLPSTWIRDPLMVLASYAASCLVVSIGGMMVLGWQTFSPVSFDRETYGSLLHFSLPVSISSWAGLFGTSWVDYVIIKGSLSMSDLGLYSLAGQLAGVVQQVTITFSTLLLPSLSVMVRNGEEARIRTFLQQLLPYWLVGASVLFALVILGAGSLVPLVFGQPFLGSVPSLAILMVATSALALFNAFDPLISAYGATWQLLKITLVSVLVKIALALWLIPTMGITGAAVGTVFAYGTSALLVMTLVYKRTGVPVLRMGFLMAPVLIVCCCVLLLQGVGVFIFGILGGALSVYGLVHAFGLFNNKDKDFLKGLWFAAFGGVRA